MRISGHHLSNLRPWLLTAVRLAHLPRHSLLLMLAAFLQSFSISLSLAQQIPQPGAPAGDISNIPKDVSQTIDRINAQKPGLTAKTPHIVDKDPSCLMSPLNQVHGPTVSATALRIPGKAKKEYGQACDALQHKKTLDAENHLNKAVRAYPKYALAWVTLGQMLAAQQHMEEAHNACSQAAAAENTYVPAYLCLAELAARTRSWDEMLKLSERALELEPGMNPIAYEYNAAANLKLGKLDDAEKSALRALDIDKLHSEPRVHFVLAQIYEAKGEPAKEAAQLQEYLKYATNSDDIALVKQSLAQMNKQAITGDLVDHPAVPDRAAELASSSQGTSSRRSWGPADIDELIPPVLNDGSCPLPQILKETSARTQDLIDNLQRFSASERIEQVELDKNGKKRNEISLLVNYVAQIQENSYGYPTIDEYRAGNTAIEHGAMTDNGTAAFALIFHPTHLGNFEFRCEGLSELLGSPAWQVHFEESPDPNKAFIAVRVRGSIYLPRFKGRAWISAGSYEVLRIDTDLLSPIPQIDLQREHFVINYAPVEFKNRRERLWLPQSTSIYLAYRGHRYERVHTFGEFQLFSIDSDQAIKEPVLSKYLEFQ